MGYGDGKNLQEGAGGTVVEEADIPVRSLVTSGRFERLALPQEERR